MTRLASSSSLTGHSELKELKESENIDIIQRKAAAVKVMVKVTTFKVKVTAVKVMVTVFMVMVKVTAVAMLKRCGEALLNPSWPKSSTIWREIWTMRKMFVRWSETSSTYRG